MRHSGAPGRDATLCMCLLAVLTGGLAAGLTMPATCAAEEQPKAAIRNPIGKALPVLERSYLELADLTPQIPDERGIIPRLLDRVVPLHQLVDVDAYIPGCPPPADRIRRALHAARQCDGTGVDRSVDSRVELDHQCRVARRNDANLGAHAASAFSSF